LRNRGGEDGWTALLAAAGEGHREAVECLLEYWPPKWEGVAEDVRHLVNVIGLMIATTRSPVHGESSMLLAAGNGSRRVDMDPHKKQCNMVVESSHNVVVDEVEQYLRRRRGADMVNVRANCGNTALPLSTRNGHSHVVAALQNRGAVEHCCGSRPS
jgi:ankyrin repeat protein